jgi:hypothetical protein
MACLAGASAAEGPLLGADAFAWLGSWTALRTPTLAAPQADGEATGTLEGVFEATWTRTGNRLALSIRRTAGEWCGRLGVRFRLAGDTAACAYGIEELPVRVPLATVGPGLVVSTWRIGAPRWLCAESAVATDGVLIGSRHQHGFFLYRTGENTFDAHCALDSPAVGETVGFEFRLLPGATATGLGSAAREALGVSAAPSPDAPAAARLRETGFVKVDDAGRGFVDGTGKPWYAMGCNLPDLMALSETEQEAELAKAEAARMTVMRVLVPDSCFRPLYGVWNDEAIRRLQATVERCAAHGLRVLVCLEYSAHGYQYNASVHLSPVPGDLYLMERPLAEYQEIVERIVVPLRDAPAIFAWDVSNEPTIEPATGSPVLPGHFREWLRSTYAADEALRTAWGAPVSLTEAEQPAKDEYEKQSSQRARDFFAFAAEAVGKSMVARAKLVRAADGNHPITIGHWQFRLLRGIEGAAVFDFWAYHTYDLWLNGPVISEHVLYLAAGLRDALPDRRRPVVIEEFGIQTGAKYSADLSAEHIRQFIAAGKCWGLAGLMHWWEMSPEMLDAYRDADPYAAGPEGDGPLLGLYLPPTEEWQSVFYPRYMTRRWWGQAMQAAAEAGWRLRLVADPEEARTCRALLVLADRLQPPDLALVRAANMPAHLLPGDEQAPDGVTVLAREYEEQVRYWRQARER